MTTTCPSCESYQRLLGDRTVEIVRQHDEIKALKAELGDYKLLVRAMGDFTQAVLLRNLGCNIEWVNHLPIFTPELRAELQKVVGG